MIEGTGGYIEVNGEKVKISKWSVKGEEPRRVIDGPRARRNLASLARQAAFAHERDRIFGKITHWYDVPQAWLVGTPFEIEWLKKKFPPAVLA